MDNGMEKYAQLVSAYGAVSGRGSPSLGDLVARIVNDVTMSRQERDRVVSALRTATGNAPDSTPISALTSTALGGTVGFLISKYFRMGIVGQAVSTLVGAGIGRQIGKRVSGPKPPPGWRWN